MRKILCILAVLALASSAQATLLFSDDFSGSGAVAGQNGWNLNQNGGLSLPGPVMTGGEAVWDTAGGVGNQLDLSQQLGTQSTGTLNAYFDLTFNYVQPTFDQGSNMNYIRFFSSTGAEVWRMRVWSGQYPEGVQVNAIDDIKHNSSVIGSVGMGEKTSFFISWNLDAKTYSLDVNGVRKVTNDTSYWGTSWTDISRIEWNTFSYLDLKGFTSGSSSMDNVAVYLNETRPVVPEPASLLALFSGLVGVVGFARRRK